MMDDFDFDFDFDFDGSVVVTTEDDAMDTVRSIGPLLRQIREALGSGDAERLAMFAAKADVFDRIAGHHQDGAWADEARQIADKARTDAAAIRYRQTGSEEPTHD